MTGASLQLEHVSVTFHRRESAFGGAQRFQALNDVSLDVGPGECVGLIGESGSGKSTLGQVAVGLLKPQVGRVTLAGEPCPDDPSGRPRPMRRFLQIVFQDPYASLDPTMSVEQIVAEGPAIHRLGSRTEQRERARAALAEVGLGPSFRSRRPHELSGGQRQRVAIARALAVDPEVVILDEPTSALDLSVQAQILNLLLDLQARRGLAFLLITHDIEVVAHMAHKLFVMRAGEIVESGAVEAVLRAPAHPYTQRLLAAAPVIDFAS